MCGLREADSHLQILLTQKTEILKLPLTLKRSITAPAEMGATTAAEQGSSAEGTACKQARSMNQCLGVYQSTVLMTLQIEQRMELKVGATEVGSGGMILSREK